MDAELELWRLFNVRCSGAAGWLGVTLRLAAVWREDRRDCFLLPDAQKAKCVCECVCEVRSAGAAGGREGGRRGEGGGRGGVAARGGRRREGGAQERSEKKFQQNVSLTVH